MSANRPGAGRGRRLAVVAAVLMLVGCLLPWYTSVGDLPRDVLGAWDGSGVLVSIAALATLALVALPLAMPDRDLAGGRGPARPAIGRRRHDPPDRPIAYILLAALAILGVALWPAGHLDRPAGLLPDRAPGLWLAAVGALLLAWAAGQVGRERRTD